MRNAPFLVCFSKKQSAMEHFSREIQKTHAQWNKADLQWSIARLLCKKIVRNGPLRVCFSKKQSAMEHLSREISKTHAQWSKADLQWSIARLLF
jgi:hypothetical protein